MTRGLGLFLVICALATVPLYDRPLGIVAVLGLVLMLFTPALGHTQAAEPGEDAQAAKGKGS